MSKVAYVDVSTLLCPKAPEARRERQDEELLPLAFSQPYSHAFGHFPLPCGVRRMVTELLTVHLAGLNCTRAAHTRCYFPIQASHSPRRCLYLSVSPVHDTASLLHSNLQVEYIILTLTVCAFQAKPVGHFPR